MPLLKAKMQVRCPQSNLDVDVQHNCLDNCRHYSHIAYIMGIPHIYCLFPKYKEEGAKNQ